MWFNTPPYVLMGFGSVHSMRMPRIALVDFHGVEISYPNQNTLYTDLESNCSTNRLLLSLPSSVFDKLIWLNGHSNSSKDRLYLILCS